MNLLVVRGRSLDSTKTKECQQIAEHMFIASRIQFHIKNSTLMCDESREHLKMHNRFAIISFCRTCGNILDRLKILYCFHVKAFTYHNPTFNNNNKVETLKLCRHKRTLMLSKLRELNGAKSFHVKRNAVKK
jgi:hypothetical protein